MKFPDSLFANNLRACNSFKISNDGKQAENELQHILDIMNSSYTVDNPLIKHNLCVFRGGENALQVFPSLLDIIPEARLNLVTYHLKNEDIEEAYALIKDLEPMKPQEFILKGVVNALKGQLHDSREHLKRAQNYFQIVGASTSECDTIPGRQCMASCYFLLRQFDDVLIYLKSIQSFFLNEESFNWNYGISLAAAGKYKEAEDALVLVQHDKNRNDPCYINWLARCFIMNGKPTSAWDLYMKMESSTSSEAVALLQLIANDCYRVGAFYHSARAFDMLERIDNNVEYWEGKKGACVGVFQLVLAGKEQPDMLRDIFTMLKSTNSPQVDYIIRTMKKGCKEHKIPV